MKDQKDVIVIDADPEKWPGIAEMFSRKSPGDVVSGSFKATVAENAENTVVLSIDDLEIKLTKSSPVAEAAKKSPAARVFKGKTAEVEAEDAPGEMPEEEAD